MHHLQPQVSESVHLFQFGRSAGTLPLPGPPLLPGPALQLGPSLPPGPGQLEQLVGGGRVLSRKRKPNESIDDIFEESDDSSDAKFALQQLVEGGGVFTRKRKSNESIEDIFEESDASPNESALLTHLPSPPLMISPPAPDSLFNFPSPAAEPVLASFMAKKDTIEEKLVQIIAINVQPTEVVLHISDGDHWCKAILHKDYHPYVQSSSGLPQFSELEIWRIMQHDGSYLDGDLLIVS